MQERAKIAVAGTTGTVGRRLVDVLEAGPTFEERLGDEIS